MDYKVFGKIYHCQKAVSFPMKAIRDRSLRDLYALFRTIDNAHTDWKSVVIHFLYKDRRVDLLWTCNHYEAHSPEDISALLHFLLELENDMKPESEVYVELLDAFAEKLIVWVSNAPFKFPKNAQSIKNMAVDYGEQ